MNLNNINIIFKNKYKLATSNKVNILINKFRKINSSNSNLTDKFYPIVYSS